MPLFVRLFLCAALSGAVTACSSTNSPGGQTGNPDAAVDGGGQNDPDSGRPPRLDGGGGSRADGGNPPQGGSDEPDPVPAGPTSIYPSGGSAVGRSDNYRLQVVVGAPAPMNEGSSENFKLRIGARLQ